MYVEKKMSRYSITSQNELPPLNCLLIESLQKCAGPKWGEYLGTDAVVGEKYSDTSTTKRV